MRTYGIYIINENLESFYKNLATKEQSDSLILRSAVKVEDITDPIRPVEALIGRIERAELLRFYRIANFKTVEEFLG